MAHQLVFRCRRRNPSGTAGVWAELHCFYGSQNSFLIVGTDDVDINNLSGACIEDCVAFTNIEPFGTCYLGAYCKDIIKLAEKWENDEPQRTLINNKEIITTESILMCERGECGDNCSHIRSRWYRLSAYIS